MIDFDDVQSVILRPSRARKVHIRFVRHTSPDDMQTFLEWAAEAITTTAKANELAAASTDDNDPPGALCVGITGEGLRLCGIEERVFSALPATFTGGMRAAAPRLHDDPTEWEAPFEDQSPFHAVVLRYHSDPDQAPEAEDELVWHGERREDSTEPFGFKDNVSDPVIEGSGKPISEGAGVWDPVARAWRPIRAGEAVLGYVDESGGIAGTPDTAYLERNGSYFVIRKLEQHVETFWAACQEWAGDFDPALDPEEIGAQLVGRYKDGRVLGQPVGAKPANGFLFRENRSPDVPKAPVPPSAHIRRSNPRDGLDFADNIVPRHVLFRRGYPYKENDGREGLLFMACCADLRRQFEFVQSHWLQDGNRFGLGTETDGLAGQRHGEEVDDGDNRVLSIARGDERVCKAPMPSFVTTRGGEYFLLPSRSALRVLATSRQPGRSMPWDPDTPRQSAGQVFPGTAS